ncbi:hypothetical protein [Gemella sanguinis]|mgnify:FL=1
MRRILKIVSVILLGVILIMNTGCARKGSRAWVERKVENMEKVYPTENLEDLFEKFSDGFYIRQIRLVDGDDKNEGYSYVLELKGDKENKTIKGNIEKYKVKSEPYERTLIEKSNVEYVKSKGLVLDKPELTEDLLPRNYFIFQKTKLNKEVLNNWRFINKGYSFETGVFDIKYNVIDSEISNYFNIDRKTELKVDLGGVDLSAKDSYKYSLKIENKENNINYYEIISNSKEDIKDEE